MLFSTALSHICGFCISWITPGVRMLQNSREKVFQGIWLSQKQELQYLTSHRQLVISESFTISRDLHIIHWINIQYCQSLSEQNHFVINTTLTIHVISRDWLKNSASHRWNKTFPFPSLSYHISLGSSVVWRFYLQKDCSSFRGKERNQL